MTIERIPFLTYSEFIRAKLKNWMMFVTLSSTALYIDIDLFLL